MLRRQTKEKLQKLKFKKKLLSFLVLRRNTRPTTRERPPRFPLTNKPTNTILSYTNTKTHSSSEAGRGRAYLGRSVFTWRPEGAVKAHKSAYFACTWEPTKHFSLLSIILIAQHDSSAPNLQTPPTCYTRSTPPPPWPDGFFLTVCGLLHLCSTTTKSLRWLGGVEWRVLGFLRGQMVLEVAEQIKRIKKSLFTDTSKLFWRWAMDPHAELSLDTSKK